MLPFAFANIDDVLIASCDIKEHQDHLLQVFERLTHFGLKINLSKCEFAVSKLNFLGHMIDEQGITPVPEKVTAIQNFPQPTSLRQLRRFLGLVNYYRRFIPGCSRILTPLTNMLQQQKNKDAKIQIEGEALTAFYNAKKALADFTKLSYISNENTSTLSLTTDASGDSIGAVLQQKKKWLGKTNILFLSEIKHRTEKIQHLLKGVTGNLLVNKALSSLTRRTRFHRFH